MNVRQRRKLFAGAGLITMLLGALLTLAPSGALAAPENPATDPANYSFDVVRTVDGNDTPDDTSDDVTTFTYTLTWIGGGAPGAGISHATFGAFCLEPNEDRNFSQTDGSTGVIGWGAGELDVGDSVSFTFDGDVPSVSDGATITIKQSNDFRTATFPGPDCDTTPPPYECPDGQVHSGDDGDGVEEQGECFPPYDCPAETPVHNDVDGDGFEERGECEETPPYECPENTVHSGDDGDGVEEEGECFPPYDCPAETPVHNDVDGDGFEERGECGTARTCPQGTTHVDGNGNQRVDDGECQTTVPVCTVNCGPVVIDDCPNLDGFQAPGTDCTPPLEDVCPETPGRQTMLESCVEVLPEEVTPPSPPTPPAPPAPAAPAPPAEPQPEVQGDVVTRTLPRTGTESQDLAAFGAGLLLLGAGLVLTSRLRFRSVD